MAKRPEMKDLSSDFMEEANSLGKRKGDLQIERQKLQMEIDYRRNLVTDEKIICDKLTDFTGLFEELPARRGSGARSSREGKAFPARSSAQTRSFPLQGWLQGWRIGVARLFAFHRTPLLDTLQERFGFSFLPPLQTDEVAIPLLLKLPDRDRPPPAACAPAPVRSL